MIKNQKGVTISMLAVTIIVLVILAGITISTGSNLIRTSKLRNYITTMNLIKLEVEKTFEEFEFENNNISKIRGVGEDSEGTEIEWKDSVLQKKSDSMTIDDTLSTKEIIYINTNTPVIERVKQSEMEGMLSGLTESEKDIIINPVVEAESNSINAENLWFKWYGPVLDSLKIEYTNMFDADDDASEIYFYINYVTGEVIYPKGYRGPDGLITYSLSGLSELSE